METFTYNSKLYKIRLVKDEQDIFGNPIPSDDWEVLAKALNDDLHKKKEFKFLHPKSKKPFYRHYVDSPANGNTMLVVGQFNDKVHFAYVRILLNSYLYKEPYLVIERYDSIVRNPDYLAEMVKKAFNCALEGSGQSVMLEPWETHGETITWCWDYTLSYDYQLRKIKGDNLIKAGFEDSLEENERKEKKKQSKKREKTIKSLKMEDHLKKGNKAKIVKMVRDLIKGKTNSKDISMPIRFLRNHDFFHNNKLPLKVFLAEFKEVKGYISKTRYNFWTNNESVSYDDDPDYNKLKKDIDNLL